MNERFECPQTNEPTILEIVQDNFTMQPEHLKARRVTIMSQEKTDLINQDRRKISASVQFQ